MSRNPDYQFVSTDTTELEAQLVTAYEQLTGTTVHPASPERLFIQWVASIVLQERALNNYTGNQNIPSRATGENLDALGTLIYNSTARPAAQAATCTVRFHISEPQTTSILVPSGTRVTDQESALFWETTADAYVAIGASYVDIPVRCQTVGATGNGYVAGQINTIVDVYDYYSGCENITESGNGADAATDDEYYELLRNSLDAYSTAGARGAYIYHAKKASTDIADVLPMRPGPGRVNLYVLMSDGTIANTETKQAVYAACNDATARPLTDYVSVEDPEEVRYDITFTYYIHRMTDRSAAEIEQAVTDTVDAFVLWQAGKLGRDINPSELIHRLMATDGIKRVALTAPTFRALADGADGVTPEVAKIGAITITSGGYEDE